MPLIVSKCLSLSQNCHSRTVKLLSFLASFASLPCVPFLLLFTPGSCTPKKCLLPSTRSFLSSLQIIHRYGLSRCFCQYLLTSSMLNQPPQHHTPSSLLGYSLSLSMSLSSQVFSFRFVSAACSYILLFIISVLWEHPLPSCRSSFSPP